MNEYDQEALRGKFIVEWQEAQSIESPRFRYNGFKPCKSVLPKGWLKEEGVLPLPCDIIYERDVSITLRDGTIVYADVFRPVTEVPVPVLFASTMFGKFGSYITLDDIPGRNGVPKDSLSGLQSWEAPDPAWWVDHGYALANVDIRGIGMSGGNACYFGSQDSDDNYDIIEFLGTQEWCNGKVGMVGNSWLAITQWYVASQNPPHLAAIAPWEGHANMYEDEYMRGGIPNFSYARPCMSYGRNKMENLQAMMRKYPLMNEYWADKSAHFELCHVPAYVVASYSSELHCRGSIEGFRRISSPGKWLRIHNTQEWPDLYDRKYTEDLRRFFDHYLKGLDNGWEETPGVRMAVLDPCGVGTVGIGYEAQPGPGPESYSRDADGSCHPYPRPFIDVQQKSGKAQLERAEKEFPLARQQLKKIYLDATTMTMSAACPEREGDASYQSDDYIGHVAFSYVFNKDTEITGYMKLCVWMETRQARDMDVYVRISKLNDKNQQVFHDAIMWQYAGPNGMLRASHRELDPARSTECEPFHPHNSLLPVKKGVPVALDIGLWPTSMVFHKGEAIVVNIAGFDYLGITGAWDDAVTFNDGVHYVHTGGRYDSYLLYPEIPL
jgi:predicted acyl esterase